MRFGTCPRHPEVRHGRTPLSADMQAYLDDCEECRETWLVSAAMRTLADATPPDPHADASADRILLLARLAAARHRERVYRGVVSSSFVLVVVIWVGLAGRAASHLPPEGVARGLVVALIALATTLWLSTDARLQVSR